MIILTLNSGSSSVKYAIWETPGSNPLCRGIVERVTQGGSGITHRVPGRSEVRHFRECPTHEEALELVFEFILSSEHGVLSDLGEITAVSHRVVSAGDRYTHSVLIDDDVIKAIEDNSFLAPLHNPANLMGIRAAMILMPAIPHTAHWDTIFSADFLPLHARLYAIPYEYYLKYGIRRYGWQGLSHLYVAKRATALMGGSREDLRIITLHIGNGSTVTAVKGGVPCDQSLGFSTCGEGLVMGTRCGDLDPMVPLFIMKQENLTIDQVQEILYRRSGVLGLTGKYVDRRDVIAAAANGDERAATALQVECHRLKKYIGAYAAVMAGLDAVVFTAGVGENSPLHREWACEGLEFLGIKIDPESNRRAVGGQRETEISSPDSRVRVFVIPTDEELVMVEDTQAILEGLYDVHTNFHYSFEDPSFVPTYCRTPG